MKARDIMHTGVECIPAHETLDRAAQRMRELDVGVLPICGEGDMLTGMITDRDIVLKCVASGHDPSKVTAGELAEGAPKWIDADADVLEVLDTMEQNRVKRLPVIDVKNDKRLVGMISESDLARNVSDEQIAEFVSKVFTPH
ncbi:CBS domain-containing protein [Streptomyces sp. UG1]|uniref:CBS domain-containing protein n=1 Tax=Streptomyces sp. UG1 TaxID=3417652 RepID=UPI003CED084B